jgi:hypothetical protein
MKDPYDSYDLPYSDLDEIHPNRNKGDTFPPPSYIESFLKADPEEMDREDLEQKYRELRLMYKNEMNIRENLKDNMKSFRSVEGFFWVLSYSKDSEKLSKEDLKYLSQVYLGGEPLICLPKGVSIDTLNDAQLVKLGLKRHLSDKSSYESYESMLKSNS